MHKIFLVFLICTGKFALSIRIKDLPCFTDESQKDLENARKELTALDNNLEKTVEILADEHQKTLDIMKNQLAEEFRKTLNNMKNQLDGMKTNVSKIVKKVDNDLIAMKKGLDEGQWKKYQEHCYYFSPKGANWFEAERLCRDFGGYLVKIDDSTENEWVHLNRPKKGSGYWIGLTDLIEGEWRWSIDQSLATFKTWVGDYGSNGHTSNCVSFSGGLSKWFDTSCKTGYYYICERNVCY